MPSYKSQINQLIGSSALNSDYYTQYLQDGAQELINIVPKDVLWVLGVDSLIEHSSVNSIAITNAGSGYSSAPNITISAPPTSTQPNTTATATCTINGSGEIDAVTITEKGFGYLEAPTITLSGSSGGVLTASLGALNHTISTNTILGVERFTSDLSLDSTGNGTYDSRNYVECREIPHTKAGRVTPGSGWLEEVTDADPVFYRKNGKIEILPKPLKSIVTTAEVPSTLTDAQATPVLPKEIDYLCVLFAASKVVNYQINTLTFPDLSNSLFTNESYTSMLNGPDFSSVNSDFPISLSDYPAVSNNTFIDSDGDYLDFNTTPTYSTPSPAINLATELSELQTFITDEDIDLAQAKAQKIQLIMSEYQAEQADQTNLFQATVSNAQNLLQEAIQNTSIDQSAKEKEKNLQLVIIKSKLE